jgi:hypothetical protein
MQRKTTIEPTGSPVRGVIPQPLRVHADTVVAHPRLAATPTAADMIKPASSPRRPNPASIVLAKLLSVIRGDKYMADAYEPAWSALMARQAAATVVRPNNSGAVAAGGQSAVASQPNTAERAAPPAAHTKER